MDEIRYNGELKGHCLYVPSKFKVGIYDETLYGSLIGGKHDRFDAKDKSERHVEVGILSCRMFGGNWCKSGEFNRKVGFTPTQNIDKSKEIMKNLSGKVREVENGFVEGFRIVGVLPNYEYMRVSILVRDPRDWSFEIDAEDVTKLISTVSVENGMIMKPCKIVFKSDGTPALMTKEMMESEDYMNLVITEEFVENEKMNKEYLRKEELDVGKVYVVEGRGKREVRAIYLGTKENMYSSMMALTTFIYSDYVSRTKYKETQCGKRDSYTDRSGYHSTYGGSVIFEPWEDERWKRTFESLKKQENARVFLKIEDYYSDSHVYMPEMWVDHYMPQEYCDFSFNFLTNLMVMKSVGKRVLRVAKDQTLGFRKKDNPKNQYSGTRKYSQHGHIDHYQEPYLFDHLREAFDDWVDVMEKNIGKYYELFPCEKPDNDYWRKQLDDDPLFSEKERYKNEDLMR